MSEMKTLKFPGDAEPREIVDAKARDDISKLSEEIANLQTSVLTTAQVNALDGMFKVCAFIKDDISEEYNAFCTAFGIDAATITGISATYSGGAVAVGTAVTDLTGIVVTAHYSDGTSKAVTGYTLDGTIADGENTITVTYQGKTATFAVTGVAESGVSNKTTWTNGVDYTFTPIANEYPDKSTGEIKAYKNWTRTPYLYCEGASKLRVTATATTSSLGGGNKDNAFYDTNKNFVSGFDYSGLVNVEPGVYVEVSIPENAAYFVLSGGAGRFPNTGGGIPNGCIKLTPYA